MWLKTSSGDYSNINTGAFLGAEETDIGSGTGWYIRVNGAAVLDTAAFGSKALAQAAIKQLTAGIDPSDIL